MIYENLLRYDKIDVYVDGKKLGFNVDGFICFTTGEFVVPNVKFDIFLMNPEALPKNPFVTLDIEADVFWRNKHDVLEFEGMITKANYEFETGIAEAEIISKGQVYMGGKPFVA